MNRFKGTKTYTTWLNDDKVSVDYVCSNLEDDEYMITDVWNNGVYVQNINNAEDSYKLEEEVNRFENDY